MSTEQFLVVFAILVAAMLLQIAMTLRIAAGLGAERLDNFELRRTNERLKRELLSKPQWTRKAEPKSEEEA